MKPLSDILSEEQILRCPECEGFAFFDWGIKLEYKTTVGPTKRFRDFATGTNILICTNCLHPVAALDGDYYDATEYIPREQIEAALERGAGLQASIKDP